MELLELKGRKSWTIEAVRSALKVDLIPQFGDRPLDRIDVRAVSGSSPRSGGGSAPKSIRNYFGVLHSIFEFGIEGLGVGEPGQAGRRSRRAPR